MKRILNLLLITVSAAALMTAYRAHMELKTNYEALEWQMNNKTAQFDAIITGYARRTHPDRQIAAQSETQLMASPAEAGQLTSRK